MAKHAREKDFHKVEKKWCPRPTGRKSIENLISNGQQADGTGGDRKGSFAGAKQTKADKVEGIAKTNAKLFGLEIKRRGTGHRKGKSMWWWGVKTGINTCRRRGRKVQWAKSQRL